jgi:hypothetical protein
MTGNNQLDGTIPTELQRLTNLTSLNLGTKETFCAVAPLLVVIC